MAWSDAWERQRPLELDIEGPGSLPVVRCHSNALGDGCRALELFSSMDAELLLVLVLRWSAI